MMKRFFALVLALSLLLTACAQAPAQKEKPATKKPEQSDPVTPQKESILSEDPMSTDSLFNYGLVCVKVGEEWGFANMDGEIVIEPQFSNPCKFSQGVLPAQKDGKWGYLNTQGEWVVEPEYVRTTGFNDGFAWVIASDPEAPEDTSKYRFKLIDCYGDVIFTPPAGYQYWPVHNGMFPARTQDGRIIVYNTSGEEVLNIEGSLFDGSEETWQIFFDGLMVVQRNDKWGYVDMQGQWVIEPKFENADVFTDGLARVQVDGKAGFIDTNGNFVIEPQYEWDHTDPSEGLIAVEGDEWRGYVDYEGNRVIDLSEYEWVNHREFKDGIAVVCAGYGSNWIYGVIDRNGNWITQTDYSFITNYNCGMASFETSDRRYGYLDVNGNEIIPANYHWTTKYYEDGYGVVMDDDGKFSILDTNGQPIFDVKFDGIGNYYVSAYENGLMHCTTGR